VREPAGHRLATRKGRRKRAYRRAMFRYVTGAPLGAGFDRWQVQTLARGRPGAVYRGDHGTDQVNR
jgi:hypothetical protein